MPKDKVKEYQKIAEDAGKIWMKHGALEYVECVGEDMDASKEWSKVPFPLLARCKEGEVPVFSFIIYKSREHRDEVNKKVMADPYMNSDAVTKIQMPFRMEDMGYGGFQSIVDYK